MTTHRPSSYLVVTTIASIMPRCAHMTHGIQAGFAALEKLIKSIPSNREDCMIKKRECRLLSASRND